jgi:hypothetical protein
MKFIRQIVIGLAFISALICVSVISVKEYPSDKVDSTATEDKVPIVKNILSAISPLLLIADKIPSLSLLPAAKVGADYEIEAAKDVYNQATDIAKNSNKNITPELPINLASTTSDSLKKVDFKEIIGRIGKMLSKGLFRFLK